MKLFFFKYLVYEIFNWSNNFCSFCIYYIKARKKKSNLLNFNKLIYLIYANLEEVFFKNCVSLSEIIRNIRNCIKVIVRFFM